jgi:hypothetical protein
MSQLPATFLGRVAGRRGASIGLVWEKRPNQTPDRFKIKADIPFNSIRSSAAVVCCCVDAPFKRGRVNRASRSATGRPARLVLVRARVAIAGDDDEPGHGAMHACLRLCSTQVLPGFLNPPRHGAAR